MLERDGFPLTWFDVLSRLADARSSGLRMQELEELALFTRGGLTRLVDRIEAAGLVRREPVPGDRRGVRWCSPPMGGNAIPRQSLDTARSLSVSSGGG